MIDSFPDKELKLGGEFEIKLFDTALKLKSYRKVKNLTMNAGVNAVETQMGTTATQCAAFTYCGVGSGYVTATFTLTALASEATRCLGSFSSGTAASGTATWSLITTFLPGTATASIYESGLFDATGLASPTMLCYNTFAVISKGSADTLVITWTYGISST